MRSRVMPGSLVTMARRVPVKRLKSVDLPTLGRPRMTRDGRVVVMKLGSGAVLHCNVSRRGTKAAKARTRRRHLVAEKIQYRGKVSERGYTPGSLYECQNKGLTKFAFRKLLILKDRIFDCLHQLGNVAEKKKKRQQSCRTPKVSLPTTSALCNGEKKLEKEKRPKAAAAGPDFS